MNLYAKSTYIFVELWNDWSFGPLFIQIDLHRPYRYANHESGRDNNTEHGCLNRLSMLLNQFINISLIDTICNSFSNLGISCTVVFFLYRQCRFTLSSSKGIRVDCFVAAFLILLESNSPAASWYNWKSFRADTHPIDQLLKNIAKLTAGYGWEKQRQHHLECMLRSSNKLQAGLVPKHSIHLEVSFGSPRKGPLYYLINSSMHATLNII